MPYGSNCNKTENLKWKLLVQIVQKCFIISTATLLINIKLVEEYDEEPPSQPAPELTLPKISLFLRNGTYSTTNFCRTMRSTTSNTFIVNVHKFRRPVISRLE